MSATRRRCPLRWPAMWTPPGAAREAEAAAWPVPAGPRAPCQADGWEGVKARFARLLGRGDAKEVERAAARLEECRALLAVLAAVTPSA
jgi:hypothetical protein